MRRIRLDNSVVLSTPIVLVVTVLIAVLTAFTVVEGAAPAARFGGTVVIGVPSDPGTLNGGITTASPAHTVADSVFNGLVQLDAQFKATPDLAESWSISSDG